MPLAHPDAVAPRQRHHLFLCPPPPESAEGDRSERDDFISVATRVIGMAVIAAFTGTGFLLGISLLRQLFG